MRRTGRKGLHLLRGRRELCDGLDDVYIYDRTTHRNVPMTVNTATVKTICSRNHVSEQEIFNTGKASQRKQTMKHLIFILLSRCTKCFTSNISFIFPM